MPRTTMRTVHGVKNELGRPEDVQIVSYDPDTLTVTLEFIQPEFTAEDLLMEARRLLSHAARLALDGRTITQVTPTTGHTMNRLVADIDYLLGEEPDDD